MTAHSGVLSSMCAAFFNNYGEGYSSARRAGSSSSLHLNVNRLRLHPPRLPTSFSLTEVAKKLLPPETPEKPKLNEYKLVTLYPQSHHPALATQPLVLQSHDSNTWIEEQALRADWAKDFDPDTGKMWTQQDRDEGKPAGARKRRLLEYMARKPFENPLDGQLTQVLFPVPVDW
mmetsp:Transcript_26463/g.66762  ORF Transcript_26463/g.66762 Transcript_26463/m.66762 type:complete len:174 (-) Transcript_26463:252-773(-)|eukprot:CAMPEP_0178995868 /NCGR_PEP_ID=MMETSP0795-20121207/8051_1 /TAXON_ID=88552 /ORGANISM="Amoebophrya sp., Strain Ameob2" /LENGTH=173 /DNA_ID=CAMNT_0020688193 /DNA_START=184 /DNA_END=705 /DNA_ORIENTATION=+